MWGQTNRQLQAPVLSSQSPSSFCQLRRDAPEDGREPGVISVPARKTTAQFIAVSQAKHGDHYDYSESEYVSWDRKVKIGCKVPGHGFFWQTPNNHTHGTHPRGCPRCVGKNRDTEIFIEEARAKH